MMNVDQITTRLSMMDDKALETFATMHKNDPYLFPLAYSESTRRQHTRMAKRAQQAMPQPKVTDAAIAQMRPAPEPDMSQMAAAGIPQLAARNIETLADGGIAGFAEGSKKPIFNVDKYLEDPRVQRFLDYINMYEGSPQPNQMVGYYQFDDLSQHPNKRVKFNKRGDKSTAAGAYQLINRTWQDQAKKQGLTDFSLENQKRAAVGVLKETGALDALMKGDVEKAKQRAARAWASIPGSTIGAATGQSAKFNPRAEQVLADIAPPTRTAEAVKPEAPRAKKREQTAGLSPELAKRVTSMLPIASAQAADEVPQNRRAAQPDFLDKLKQAAPPFVGGQGQLVSEVFGKGKASAPAALQTEPEKGIAGLSKRDKFVDPLAKQREQLSKEFTLPSGREIGSAAAATGDYLYNLLPFAAGEAGYAAGRMFGVPEESARKVPEFFAGFTDPLSRFFKTKGTAEDQAALTRKIENFVGENIHKGAEWIAENSAKYTGAPISVRDAENLMNISALALGAKGKGKGKAEPAPAVGAAEAKTRIADAEAAAATAAENAKTAALPRLEAPKPEVTPSRTLELQRRLFGEERAPQFTPDPTAQKFGVEAVLARKRAQQAADVRKAQEAATVAERKAAEVKALEEGRIGEMAAVPRTTTPAAPFVRPRTAMAAVAGGREPIPESYDDIVKTEALGSQDAGIPLSPYSAASLASAVTPEEKVSAPTTEQKKAFGLDNEDLLMLGLGMLASPGGQAGSDLSQLFSNLGRSGMGAVAAKREREKLAEEKDYKNIMKQYYGKLTEMYGRPEAEERQIARIMQENPGISYEDAVQRLYAAKFASRGEYGLEAARLRNPFAALMDQGLMGTGGNLTSEGQSVFAKYFPKG